MALLANPWGHVPSATGPWGGFEGEVPSVSGVVADLFTKVGHGSGVYEFGIGLDLAVMGA